MNRFNTIENKGIVMRSLIVLTVMLLAVGTVSAQENVTAEDFQTPKPDVGFRMNPVDGLFNGQNFTDYEADESSGFTDNGDYITVDASSNGYVSVFEFQDGNDNDEWMRGKVEITHEFSNMDNLEYRLVQVTDPTDSLTNIRQAHDLDAVSGSTNGQETITLQWDEEDLIQDSNFDVTDTKNPEHVGIQIWPTSGGDSVDIYGMDFIKSKPTYTETFYNGTLSTPWNNPETTQINGETISSLENKIVGSEGDYRWEVTTDSIYAAEYDVSLSPQELQYYFINTSVPEGAALEYGVMKEDSTEIQYGYRIENREGDTGNNQVLPIINGDATTEDAASGTPPYNGESLSTFQQYHFTLGGLIGSNRTFSLSPTLDGNQQAWLNHDSEGRDWYWKADGLYFGAGPDFRSIPNPHTGESFDRLRINMDSVASGSHTFEISEMTYGPTASDISPGDTIDVGQGDDVDPIEDRNEIVDGGIVDSLITLIANYTGLGLTATRFLLGILIALGTGLAVGWSDEYGSTTLGVVAFGFTFVSLMLVGLIPMVYGLIFMLVAGGVGWLSWKNQSQKVVMNG